jgi:hypothetical protein
MHSIGSSPSQPEKERAGTAPFQAGRVLALQTVISWVCKPFHSASEADFRSFRFFSSGSISLRMFRSWEIEMWSFPLVSAHLLRPAIVVA